MSDEPRLELKKSEGSWLVLSRPRSEIVVRGRRDAAALLEALCNKCGERRELVLESCVCASCSDALDELWKHSLATDWILLTETAESKISWLDEMSAISLLLAYEELRARKQEGPAPEPRPWPPLGLLSCCSPEAERSRPESEFPVTKYMFRNSSFEQIKAQWAKADPSGGVDVGGPYDSDVVEVRKHFVDRVVTQLLATQGPEAVERMPEEMFREYIAAAWSWAKPTLIRPATADEIDLSEALDREPERRAEIERILEKWGFDPKSIPVIGGVADASRQQQCVGAWEEVRERFRELDLLKGSVFDQETELKTLWDLETKAPPREVIDKLPSTWVRARPTIGWYRMSADRGDVDAQYKLGVVYRDGLRVERDDAEALHWFRKAAEQGNAGAQTDLGRMYHMLGDDAEAARSYGRAADGGDINAQANVGYHYDLGLGVQKNHAEAARWYRRAADRGHWAAQFNLGLLYRDGNGVPVDYVQALMWLTISASKDGGDNQKFSAARDKVVAKMAAAEIAEAERLAREWKAQS